MAQSLARIYLHIVFGTKYRLPLIPEEVEDDLYRYMAGILNNMDGTAIKIGGVSDHVHILNTMPRTISVSKMIGILKKDSSKWLKTRSDKYKKFRWQDGYGVFSVSQKDVNRVKRYIENQHRHHSRKSFKDEYTTFLNACDVKYDERYIWL